MSGNVEKSRGEILAESLQGRWRVVYSELNGQMTPVEEFSTIVLINTGNSFQVEKNGKVVDEGKFSIKVNETPNEIVYVYSSGPEIFLGAPRLGVSQLVGNTFKTCLGAVGQAAPTEFSTSPDSESVLTIYQRAGAEGGTGFAVSKTKAVSQW